MEEARSNIQSNSEEEFLESFCLLQAACNAYLAYEAGLFRVNFYYYVAEKITCKNKSSLRKFQKDLNLTKKSHILTRFILII